MEDNPIPTDHRAALANIKRFNQLIAYLRDELAWPIEGADFADLTFEYTPEELGIETKSAAKIQEIKRLRPLTSNQPWGIFFVKFEPKKLPVVALRRILGQVTLKKRASANSFERQAWAVDDLLFVSNYGEGAARQISFAHFSGPAGSRDLPTLKVLGWDDRDTALHLDVIARELSEHLAWPEDEDDVDAWRDQWRAAFTLKYQEVITTSHDLSIRLAELARKIRDRIQTALAIETEDGRITKLMKAFQEALVHDLDNDGFADMYAQTIAYGLLSARIADPHRKTADDFAGHMRTNPFLRDLMDTFLQAGGWETKMGGRGVNFDELGVAEVVELLDDANMEAVIRDFGDRNPREDPVIHFYELFLKEYDPKKRMQRGVFYTPLPMVSYIVRSVDTLLRTEFGLADGLADTTTWDQMARRHANLEIPQGISPDQDFIQILDPATGTGTFLVETIDVIHKTLKEKWHTQGYDEQQVKLLWNEYVPKHLLPRLHGYELLMAPYAIAHLKIGLKLYETGYRFKSSERGRIYLTNALEPAKDFSQGNFDFVIPALAKEAQEVDEVKRAARFTVVVGNPPYSGHSANKGEWITHLIDNYKKGFPELRKPAQAKWLSDDYVKFICFAQSLIQRTGTGVLGFITNHSYLDNPTFRGMRLSLLQDFNHIYLLDLHGNSKKKERAPDGGRDENVFDIQQGVAISLFVKMAVDNNSFAQVCHTDIWGKRGAVTEDGKYGWLVTNDVNSATANSEGVFPSPPQHLFVPRDEELIDEYEAAWPIPKIFSPSGDPAPGIVTTHDQFAISWTRKEATSKVERLLSTTSEKEAREIWRLCSQNQWQYDRAKRELAEGSWRERIETVLYRPFDLRVTVFDRNVAVHRRERVMRHMLAGDNLGLISVRQVAEGLFNHVCVARSIVDFRTTLSNKGGSYIFPLYTYPLETLTPVSTVREPNLNREFVEAIGSAIHLDFTSDSLGNLDTAFGLEDVFNYIYAVLHSPEYRHRYADFLKSDFPRVPLPDNSALFGDLSRTGKRLVGLHLMEVEGTDAHVMFPNMGSNQVEKVRYTPPKSDLPGRVWINGQQYFEGLEPRVWAFTMCGYRPAEKWLKDRKNRTLSEDDINHYRKIIAALAETRSLMIEIDDVIEQHGGWSAAFQLGQD